jgi:hypothetical protein
VCEWPAKKEANDQVPDGSAPKARGLLIRRRLSARGRLGAISGGDNRRRQDVEGERAALHVNAAQGPLAVAFMVPEIRRRSSPGVAGR